MSTRTPLIGVDLPDVSVIIFCDVDLRPDMSDHVDSFCRRLALTRDIRIVRFTFSYLSVMYFNEWQVYCDPRSVVSMAQSMTSVNGKQCISVVNITTCILLMFIANSNKWYVY